MEKLTALEIMEFSISTSSRPNQRCLLITVIRVSSSALDALVYLLRA